MQTYFEIKAEAQWLSTLNLSESDMRWLATCGYEPAQRTVQDWDRSRAYQEANAEAREQQRRLDALGIDYDVVMAADAGMMIAVVPRGRRQRPTGIYDRI